MLAIVGSGASSNSIGATPSRSANQPELASAAAPTTPASMSLSARLLPRSSGSTIACPIGHNTTATAPPRLARMPTPARRTRFWPSLPRNSIVVGSVQIVPPIIWVSRP